MVPVLNFNVAIGLDNLTKEERLLVDTFSCADMDSLIADAATPQRQK